MTRDEARALFKKSGLNWSELSKWAFQRLRNIVNEKMVQSKVISGSFRCHRRAVVKQYSHGKIAYIKCKAFYFDSRECITFNSDGFIGFAGWADDENIQPILNGFADWVNETIVLEGGPQS